MKRPRIARSFAFAAGAIALVLILTISYFHLLDNYELETLDFRFNLRPKIATTDKLAMIEIGEDTIASLGRFPFDRNYHALIVQALSEAGARAVIFDIFFSEPADHDAELESAMKKAGNVYLPYVLDIESRPYLKTARAKGYIARNLEALTLAAKNTGHINIYPDVDGKFRRVPLFVDFEGAHYPYISFLAACDYIGSPQRDIKILPGKCIGLKDGLKIPLDECSNMIINFSGKWGSSYRHYSYIDILQSYLSGLAGQKPIIDLSVFKDKLCIIGLTAAGTVDLHPNPFETLYPGVGIHAEVFNSILTHSFVRRAGRGLNIAILLLLNLLVLLLTLNTKPFKMFMMLVSAIAAFIAVGIALFSCCGLWIDLSYPIALMVVMYVAVTLYKYVTEWKRRLVLENELDIAKRIQDSFLPKSTPEVSGVDIACGMFTARQVGGDLYNFTAFEPLKLGVMIGDVSGKGVPAALFMAMVMGLFKFYATPSSRPEEVLAKLNLNLVKESSSNLFVTVFYAIFDFKARELFYSNGGHLPLIHLPAKGEVKFLDVDVGTPLGLMEGDYAAGHARFGEGDTFVFYTDGVTEAMNARSEMYEKTRLAAVVENGRGLSAKALFNAIERDIRKFEPKSSQHDDITIIVIKTAPTG